MKHATATLKEFADALKAHLAKEECRTFDHAIDDFAAAWPTSEHNLANCAPSFDEAEFAELKRKGKEAWAGVPSATGFIEELRGNAPAKIDTSPEVIRALADAVSGLGSANQGVGMKHATATLSGALLDQAVAMALGIENAIRYEGGIYIDLKHFSPSTDWAHGGPLIEAHEISISADSDGLGTTWQAERERRSLQNGVQRSYAKGPTPLIAAMRALVASKLGDEVDL